MPADEQTGPGELMCGRFVLFSEPGTLARLFDVDEVRTTPLPACWNVAPTLEVYAVVEASDGTRRLGTLRWGLVPHWARDRRSGPINARLETIADKPTFREAFRRRRCIIPADGFYEWRDGQPYLIRRADGAPLAFAGLWEFADDVATCTIVTTAARGWMIDLHDRMPVVLPRDSWAGWIDRGLDDAEAIAALAEPEAVDALVASPVSRAVNDVRNDGPHLIEPVDGPPVRTVM